MAFTALQQFGHLAMTHNLPGGTTVVDTGCTQATAGKQWLHDWAAQPETIGLKPTAKSQRQCFIGLGGFDFDDPYVWTVLVDFHHAHSTISFQKIDCTCQA